MLQNKEPGLRLALDNSGNMYRIPAQANQIGEGHIILRLPLVVMASKNLRICPKKSKLVSCEMLLRGPLTSHQDRRPELAKSHKRSAKGREWHCQLRAMALVLALASVLIRQLSSSQEGCC